MPLTREERKLLHQKSKQPTFGVNKPDTREGHEGDIAYRRVEGSGTVQYVKENGDWTAIASSGKMPKSRNIITSSSSTSTGLVNHNDLAGLSSDDHTQYLLVSGTRAMSGNLDMGTNNIGSVGTLDVDGHTTLDQVTINTADGAFAVSGANNILLTTTGTNDIVLTSAQDYDLNISGECDWHTTTTDWDNSGTFTLTSTDNLTIETSGANTAKTILLFNDNNNASAFRGIHLKTDSGNIGSSQNSIFLECDNRNSKGGGDGIDIRSEDGILIRAEDPNTGTASNIQMRATRHIDLQGGTASISPTGDAITRVKVHGITEIMQLYRPSGSSITTNLETITSPFGVSNTETGHTEFEAINTQHLLRAMTYKTSATVARGNPHTIVSATNDDNIAGTCWLVTVTWSHANDDVNSQLWMCTAVGTTDSRLVAVLVKENLESTHGTASANLTWTESAGIVWTNNHNVASASDATMKASALRMQSGNDF
jgi:general stress protein 26